MNISLVQRAVRGYSNLYNIAPGSLAPNVLTQIIGANRFIPETPVCPTGGSYSFGQDFGENTIPPMGTVYMKCSLADTADHAPEATLEW